MTSRRFPFPHAPPSTLGPRPYQGPSRPPCLQGEREPAWRYEPTQVQPVPLSAWECRALRGVELGHRKQQLAEDCAAHTALGAWAIHTRTCSMWIALDSRGGGRSGQVCTQAGGHVLVPCCTRGPAARPCRFCARCTWEAPATGCRAARSQGPRPRAAASKHRRCSSFPWPAARPARCTPPLHAAAPVPAAAPLGCAPRSVAPGAWRWQPQTCTCVCYGRSAIGVLGCGGRGHAALANMRTPPDPRPGQCSLVPAVFVPQAAACMCS